MSFFPQALISSDSSFHPLFRFIDDFDQYSRGSTNEPHRHHRGQLKSFTPKFDVKELKDGYELHGELPGIEQKDVEVEFTDNQTLTVKGRTERSYTAGTPPAGAIEGGKVTGEIEDKKQHQSTVEDEVADSQEVVKKEEQKQDDEAAKYWVSERSVGEFSRSFSFPVRVDQEGVKASMNNGVLSILVPKASKVESRKISIE